MLDDNPVLKERLMACGAFAGIALFAVAAVDVMVSGGFDFGAERADYNRTQQPSAYVRVVDAANYVGDRFRSISWDEPMFIDSAEAVVSEDLAGPNDGSPPLAMADASVDDALYAQIDTLYSADQDAAYDDERAVEEEPAYEQPSYSEQSDAESDKLASAYENASPW